MGRPGGRQPAGRQSRPPRAGRCEQPVVGHRRRRPDRDDLAVVGDEAGAEHRLDQPGGPRRVDVERLGQAPQVPDGQAAGAQHPGRGGPPELDGLLHEGEQVADLAARGGVDPVGPDRGGRGVRRSQGDLLVQPATPQQQRDLAGQQHPRLGLAPGPLGDGRRHDVEQPVVQQPAHALRPRGVPVDHPDRRPPDEPVEHAAGRLGGVGDHLADLVRWQRPCPELQRGRTQPRGVGAEHLRCCADRIQALGCPPHQGEVPEPLELRPDVQPAHQLVDRARTRPVAGHDDGLEDLEVSEVEALDRALDAGAGAGAGSERGEVRRRRAGEVGTTQDERGELLVAPAADVVGQAARPGGRRGGVGGGRRTGGHEGNGNRHFG